MVVSYVPRSAESPGFEGGDPAFQLFGRSQKGDPGPLPLDQTLVAPWALPRNPQTIAAVGASRKKRCLDLEC